MSPLPDVEIGNDEPLYNIGAVTRMTGVSMATLRAWERRYDFPEAERTSGGHRLYSEKDVVSLRWIKARIDEGMQTAQAIHALRHQQQAGHLVESEVQTRGLEKGLDNQSGSSRFDLPERPGAHLSHFRERLANSLLRRNIQKADTILGEALALSSPEDLILDVIAPTFSAIGESWEQHQISVATEHLATNYLRQRLLMWMLSGPPPRQINPIVLACAPNEWHEGSLLILGALLRRKRWPVAYLGQAVPLPDLAAFVRDLAPSLAILVAMTESTALELLEWPHWLPDAAQRGQPVIGYGGRAFTLQPELRLRMAGTFLGESLRDGIVRVESILLKKTGD